MAVAVENIIAGRLQLVARDADSQLISRQSEIWEQINPSPSCPRVSDVVEGIHRTCIEAVRYRSNSASSVLHSVLSGAKMYMTPELATGICAILDEHLPNNLYVQQVDKIPGVYARRNNSGKFREDVFAVTSQACRVGISGLIAAERCRLHLEIDQYCQSLARPPLWKAVYESHGKAVVVSLVSAGILALLAYLAPL